MTARPDPEAGGDSESAGGWLSCQVPPVSLGDDAKVGILFPASSSPSVSFNSWVAADADAEPRGGARRTRRGRE